MSPMDLKSEFEDIVDNYYNKLSECKTLSELMELNWYSKDRLMNLGYKAFNETWENGWCGEKDNEAK
jgi:hypothetical protein